MAEPITGQPFGKHLGKPFANRLGIAYGKHNDLSTPMQMQCKEHIFGDKISHDEFHVKFSNFPSRVARNYSLLFVLLSNTTSPTVWTLVVLNLIPQVQCQIAKQK